MLTPFFGVTLFINFELSVERNLRLLWVRFISQSDWSRKPAASSFAFSGAPGSFHVFTLSSHGPLVIFSSYLIRCCDFFSNGFTNLDPNARGVGSVFMLFLSATILW